MKADRILSAAASFLSAAIVFAAMCVSFYANGGIGNAPEASREESAVSVFSDFRRERQDVRDLEIRQLNAIAQDLEADEDIRTRAYAEILSLTKNMEAEATIESVLIARGHKNAVVTVHAGSVNVVIENRDDNKAESAFILDLVMRETGQTAGNVKIMTVYES